MKWIYCFCTVVQLVVVRSVDISFAARVVYWLMCPQQHWINKQHWENVWQSALTTSPLFGQKCCGFVIGRRGKVKCRTLLKTEEEDLPLAAFDRETRWPRNSFKADRNVVLLRSLKFKALRCDIALKHGNKVERILTNRGNGQAPFVSHPLWQMMRGWFTKSQRKNADITASARWFFFCMCCQQSLRRRRRLSWCASKSGGRICWKSALLTELEMMMNFTTTVFYPPQFFVLWKVGNGARARTACWMQSEWTNTKGYSELKSSVGSHPECGIMTRTLFICFWNLFSLTWFEQLLRAGFTSFFMKRNPFPKFSCPQKKPGIAYISRATPHVMLYEEDQLYYYNTAKKGGVWKQGELKKYSAMKLQTDGDKKARVAAAIQKQEDLQVLTQSTNAHKPTYSKLALID